MPGITCQTSFLACRWIITTSHTAASLPVRRAVCVAPYSVWFISLFCGISGTFITVMPYQTALNEQVEGVTVLVCQMRGKRQPCPSAETVRRGNKWVQSLLNSLLWSLFHCPLFTQKGQKWKNITSSFDISPYINPVYNWCYRKNLPLCRLNQAEIAGVWWKCFRSSDGLIFKDSICEVSACSAKWAIGKMLKECKRKREGAQSR